MKRLYLLLLLSVLTINGFAQSSLQGFSETVKIGEKEYLLSDSPLCADYHPIAELNYFKSMFGKYPAYGLIDKNNNIILPCQYVALLPDEERGCIFAFKSNKKLLGGGWGAFDYKGNELVPCKYASYLKDMAFPHKRAAEAFDKLDASVKQNCLAVFNDVVNSVDKSTEPLYAQETAGSAQNSATTPAVQNVPAQQVPAPAPSSDVDVNIPVTGRSAENTFVLIIANEDYMFVDNVDFAKNDGQIFKEYCVKTLGVPERQVWLYENASYGIINSGVSKMVQAMNLFDSPNAIIYYCGHGIPDEKTGDAYIIPTDGNGKDMSTCYSLNKLYSTFASTKAGNITYFMDACFTGANKEGGMLIAARGVAREPKKEVLGGNAVVFSATSADETAMAFKEKQHGLFTYYLLKKLQETKGEVNYNDLSEYINKNVKKEAFLTNEKPQTPMVATSAAMQNTWKAMTLR